MTKGKPMTLRMDEELKQMITARAKKNRRSFTAELEHLAEIGAAEEDARDRLYRDHKNTRPSQEQTGNEEVG